MRANVPTGRMRRAARPLLACALLLGAGMVTDAAETPRPQGGHFPATVNPEHEAAIALTVGEGPPGLAGLAAELLTGRPRVPDELVHQVGRMSPIGTGAETRLAESAEHARAAAASLLGEEGPVAITHAGDPSLLGARVDLIAGSRARIGTWWAHLDGILEAAYAGGAPHDDGIALTLEDGREIEVHVGVVTISRHTASAGSGEAAAESPLTTFYRVAPMMVLQPVGPDGDGTLAPPGVEGPSAGLAYALSYLNAETGGELFAGRRIAATGAITPSGQVKAVGGFPAKGEAAVRSGAEILFVSENSHHDPAGESRIRVVEVFQLADAVHHLCQNVIRASPVTTTVCRTAEEAVSASAASVRGDLPR